MVANISGYGLRINLISIPTFPSGLSLTQFADDSDPFDLPSIQIADKRMGLNGELIVYATANPIVVSLGIIPNTPDDKNLGILFALNRPGKGKIVQVMDSITLTGIYPDGSSITLTNGVMTDGMPGQSVASGGAMKTKVYSFAFENFVGVP